MKKLIVIDIDGTLFNSNNTVSKRTRNAIKKIIDLGHYVVLCSGRPRPSVCDICAYVGASEFIISSTGTEIYDINKHLIIDSSFLPINDIVKMFNYSKEYGIKMKLACFDQEYCSVICNSYQKAIPNDIINFLQKNPVKQIMFIHPDYKLLEIFKKYIRCSTNVKIVDETIFNNEPWFSVINAGSSKGNMVLCLADYLNISKNNIITIGNDYNDISMFRITENSFAMKNSNEIVKNHAFCITESNDDEGVAIVLEKILKEKTP